MNWRWDKEEEVWVNLDFYQIAFIREEEKEEDKKVHKPSNFDPFKCYKKGNFFIYFCMKDKDGFIDMEKGFYKEGPFSEKKATDFIKDNCSPPWRKK